LWLGVPAAVPPDVTLADMHLFPPLDVARATTLASQRYQCEAARLQSPHFGSSPEARAWHAWRAYHVRDAYVRWYILDDSKLLREATTDEQRLVLLRRLREWMGTAAYAHGALPSPAPWGWHAHAAVVVEALPLPRCD